MTVASDFDLDKTGKIDLTAIYDQPDPRGYYQTLATLEYRIPESASAVVARIIGALRRKRRQRRVTVLDVGSSYGVNAALLKHRYGLAELFNLYGRDATAGRSRQDLIARDRSLFQGDGDSDLRTIGLDVAESAIDYACEARLLDAGIVADLESGDPGDREASLLAPTDLVISTGAIGYVDAPTFRRILDNTERLPWLALFALRMFPVDRIVEFLRTRGYSVFRASGQTFRQRRFAGRDERAEVLSRLRSLGIDPKGHESEGWYHAEFFFALPEGEAIRPPIANAVPVY
ncbi:MAG: class I SAM-dependent methyltransferase [Bauldia sp.]|uniref:class I SAM-dependent methyltransferase n=1 Tax=Bauldia sp. TaxID=2575872 RepID=UPI001DDBCD9B|nr:class I SAM-dependent methyltransferase [Bauldia sp.]MCB1490034.1 class I SAM-dependent methyltransferase [Bauldia sp.]MCB1496838.1 class I SAM-dependent methyltransferase [Bauldia sp.]